MRITCNIFNHFCQESVAMSGVVELFPRSRDQLIISEESQAVVSGGELVLEIVLLHVELLLVCLLGGVVPDPCHVAAQLPHRDPHLLSPDSLLWPVRDVLPHVSLQVHLPLLPQLGQDCHGQGLADTGDPHHAGSSTELVVF